MKKGYIMKKIRKGFTLAEVLVVLSVLGVVAAVTMPMLNHIRPNQEQCTGGQDRT